MHHRFQPLRLWPSLLASLVLVLGCGESKEDPGSQSGGTGSGAAGGGAFSGTAGQLAAGASGGGTTTGGAPSEGGTTQNGGGTAGGGAGTTGGAAGTGGVAATGGTAGQEGISGAGAGTGGTGGGGAGGGGGSGGNGGTSGGGPTVDPSLPLTPVAFYPSKSRIDACADAAISVEFNRAPVIKSGFKIEVHDSTDAVVDSITSKVGDLYYSDLATRNSFQTDALDVVFNTVVFHPQADFALGKTYYVTIAEGMITDSAGTKFSVQKSDGWSFTVRAQKRDATGTLNADGSGDYCSLQGLLNALPDTASTTRVVQVGRGVYPGIVRMKESQLHFQGAGAQRSVFSHKNSAKMNSSREGIVLSGSDVTFEDLTIFNTYRKDSDGQQAEALYVSPTAKRVFLNEVHLRSHQDTLRVDGQAYMLGGKISGSTDPLWGTGSFYCDGCELMSRTSGHAFVVARSTQGFALVNCRVTKESAGVGSTYLGQVHSGAEPGKIAFVGCALDSHIVGWKEPADHDWYEYGNTKLNGGAAAYNGKQLRTGDAVLQATSSAQSWLGWSP
jgi:pectin methylesterase-like acyl-CoA thioesterase